MVSILTDANTQWVLMATMLLGVASGMIGSFALLKKQSLIGDAVAHASLPGICIAFLISGEKTFSSLMIGATISGLLATYFIHFITKRTILKEDSAICLILSVFFGMGIVLLTKITQSTVGNQSGLDDFIFGHAASLVGNDVKLMSGIAVITLLLILSFFKELKLVTFDPDFAQGIGLPLQRLNFLFLTLYVAIVVVGIQAVGVILMAALIITPAISARYWTHSLSRMIMISGAFGAISGLAGTLISTLKPGLPTGPFIVITATVIFILSITIAPERGFLIKSIKRLQAQKELKKRGMPYEL
jgi:ABC-type Mn2+/Zn2+ transport system permease subunit